MTRSTEKFTVDAALLRELGERLVGQPHIALAELIKNAYDADARHVKITFDGDRIVLEDDGHGMSYHDFVSYWMRVGTTHKRKERVTPELGRSYTGSKGVGRLAAQVLANRLEVVTVALQDKTIKGFSERTKGSVSLHQRVTADVRWDQSVKDGELTSVEVPVERDRRSESFVGGSQIGTRLVMTDLVTVWDEDRFRSLAQEIWQLQPPFEVDVDEADAFVIELVSPYGEVVEEFAEQMNAIFDNWQSVIKYRVLPDEPGEDVLFEFDPLASSDVADEEDEDDDDIIDVDDFDAEPDDEDDEDIVDLDDSELDDDDAPSESDSLDNKQDAGNDDPIGPTKILEIDIFIRTPVVSVQRLRLRIVNCLIDTLDCEIRTFNLTHRQANNVTVADSRKYMGRFGGVHIYDGPFRLPYYGPQDWLGLERDHARRQSRSALMPVGLRRARSLHDLPSARRIYGTAKISTAHEAETGDKRGAARGDILAIQVTRDRLVDNDAFTVLQRIVRVGLDLYATELARARASALVRTGPEPLPRPSEFLNDLRQSIEAVRGDLDEVRFQSIVDYVEEAESGAKLLESDIQAFSSLFGSLATVGMTTLAWEHEATKQRLIVMDSSRRLKRIAEEAPRRIADDLAGIASELAQSARSMNDVARLFKPVLDQSSRETVTSMRAKRFVETIAKQLKVLARGAKVTTSGIPDDLMLAPATLAAWSAILQNLLVNAFNAVLEEDERLIDIDGGVNGRGGWLRIEDTGVGVDLNQAEKFFEPFVRGMKHDPRRAELGLGGSGLGLTIVRMIAEPIGVSIRFVEPTEDFNTAVRLEWK